MTIKEGPEICEVCGGIKRREQILCDGCWEDCHNIRESWCPDIDNVLDDKTTLVADTHEQKTFGPIEDPHVPGAKLDAGKVRVGLVLGGFAKALLEVSKVGTKGAAKYSDNGWMQVPDGINRYTDALGRHLLKDAAGEKLDPEWDLPHAAHAAWNALARLELILRNGEKK